MPIITGRPDPGEMYTPEADVTETLPDGRTIQIAVAGVPMARRDAIKAGLLPDPTAPATGPRETKEGPRRAPAVQVGQPAEAARPPVPGATPGEKAP